jgi:hypothetical protein
MFFIIKAKFKSKFHFWRTKIKLAHSTYVKRTSSFSNLSFSSSSSSSSPFFLCTFLWLHFSKYQKLLHTYFHLMQLFFYFNKSKKVEQAEKVLCFIIDFKFPCSQLMHLLLLITWFFLSYVLCKNAKKEKK